MYQTIGDYVHYNRLFRYKYQLFFAFFVPLHSLRGLDRKQLWINEVG